MATDPALPSVRERLVLSALDGLRFCHVDVFADAPLSGNGLVVVLGAQGLEHDRMLRVTQEMRQFETIFLDRPVPGRACSARVFTVEEELLFAGHPVLGAAAVMHALLEDAAPEEERTGWCRQAIRSSCAKAASPVARRACGYPSHRVA